MKFFPVRVTKVPPLMLPVVGDIALTWNSYAKSSPVPVVYDVPTPLTVTATSKDPSPSEPGKNALI